METCLFNTCSNHSVAYCKYHHCGMTVKQMKCKKCLNKQCWYLEKNFDHDYWKNREKIKQKRKERKININNYLLNLG